MKLDDLKVLVNREIDFKEYLRIDEKVKNDMKNPEWFGGFNLKKIEELIEKGANVWLFYDRDEAVCSMMSIPCKEEDMDSFNLSYDHLDCIDYGPIFVCQKYRGLGLQVEMLNKLNDYFSGTHKYAITTIHPNNTFSINNFLKVGFKLYKSIDLSRGKRNIYIKELDKKK